MSQPIIAHGSHTAWRLRRYKAILKLLPQVLEKSNAQFVGTLMVVLLAVGGATGFGIVIDGYAIQGQVNITRECPAPLILNSNGCFTAVVSHILVNGKNTTTANLVPADGIPYP